MANNFISKGGFGSPTEEQQEAFEHNKFFFVYGTLKSAYGNNRILDWSSRFVCEAATRDKYFMASLGCPTIAPNSEGLPVLGEVWEINDIRTLIRLDSLEGEGSFYHRRERDLDTGNKAWLYEIEEDPRWQLGHEGTIKGGHYIWP